MHKRRILIIGQIFVDTHLDVEGGDFLRLGGIFHAARAYSALGNEYAIAYYAPEYLNKDIQFYAQKLKVQNSFRLGIVDKSPNVMIIKESKEVGDQGYVNVLWKQVEYHEDISIDKIIVDFKPTDVVIYPGSYNIENLIFSLNKYEIPLHIDFHYESTRLLSIKINNLSTIMISTSSSLFKDQYSSSVQQCIEELRSLNVEHLLIKENRGGSCCYSFKNNTLYEAPSYYVKTKHSVGVGDVYNSFFISDIYTNDIEKRMKTSALCASSYAETFDQIQFENNINIILKNLDDLINLEGVRLSWDERKAKNIYIAAPDFPNVRKNILNQLVESLKYHNFTPRLPIRENGLFTDDMGIIEEQKIYLKDYTLLNDCDLLIAVLLYNDPGTHVELGSFKQSGKPTIIFDPYDICENLFVKNTPNYYCNKISEVIDATYDSLKRR